MAYDIRDLVKAKQGLPLEVEVEGLGLVRFMPLSVKEIEQCQGIADISERNMTMLWMMLSKVEPDLTLEEIKVWRMDIVDEISVAIMKRMDFRAKRST